MTTLWFFYRCTATVSIYIMWWCTLSFFFSLELLLVYRSRHSSISLSFHIYIYMYMYLIYSYHKNIKKNPSSDANIITSFPFTVLIFDYIHFDIEHIICVGCRLSATRANHTVHSTGLEWHRYTHTHTNQQDKEWAKVSGWSVIWRGGGKDSKPLANFTCCSIHHDECTPNNITINLIISHWPGKWPHDSEQIFSICSWYFHAFHLSTISTAYYLLVFNVLMYLYIYRDFS